MKLSYQWLKELVSFKESPDQLAKLLTTHVAQVEDAIDLGKGLDKVVAAKIIEIKKHPSADKLQVVVVQISEQGEKLTIVCGAPNIKVGQMVPLALPGARLPNGMEIKEAEIRGIKSFGMLCAEDEIGIGPDHMGIYILPAKVKLGEALTKTLQLNDVVLDVENKSITHRPDLFSINGFAKEISAIKGLKLLSIKKKLSTGKAGKKSNLVKIQVKDSRLCPRYMAVIIDGIKTGPSPLWMQNRLRNLGIRPINNVVDITNYILLEVGQPLHAFDLNKVDKKSIRQSAKKNIIIRPAKIGEKIMALDGKTYELAESDVVIADSTTPIALAGLMGGEYSGIDSQTKTIMIESAIFEPATIRRSAWRLGLRTEAALRFEKGLPISFPEQGLTRAIELIEQLTGGKVVSQTYDIKSAAVSKLLKNKKIINLDCERARQFIGADISSVKMAAILKSLDYGVTKGANNLRVTVPLSRPDIEQEEDLIEDITRIYGSEKIVPRPIGAALTPVDHDPTLKLEKEMKQWLNAVGFDEIYNYSFYSEKLINLLKMRMADHLALANPLSPQLKYLRISLLPYLVENTAKNIALFNQFRIFECGHTYQREGEAVKEEKYCAGAILEKNKNIFYTTKGALESIIGALGVDPQRLSYQVGKNANYQYLKKIVGVFVDKKLIGMIGEVGGALKSELKITADWAMFEINLETLLDFVITAKKFKSISFYPSILRDLSFLVSKTVVFADLWQTIKNFNSLISSAEPFDIFESEKLGAGVRNVAFHLVFQSFERTLKSEEIDRIMNDLVKLCQDKFSVKLRNF
jgi:phenylalanyl-tRNA synthetase beta chain